MGYNGMGYQRWIATLKPRKFLSKRSKPDGGGMDKMFQQDINYYYHFNSNSLQNLKNIKISHKYRKQLDNEIKTERRKTYLFNTISLVIALAVCISVLIYLLKSFEWF